MPPDGSSPPIAFVCAMPMELVPLTEKLGLTETEIGGSPARVGKLGGRDVVAMVTGMGTDFARAGVERLLNSVNVARVVVVGITGALESETPMGTLIRPEVVVNSATGSEHRPDPMGAQQPHGHMWTTDVLITDPDALMALRARGVVALDMETAVIAEVCEARAIPWAVFRAISDRANDGTLDEEVFRLSNQDGTPNHEAMAEYFARHPEKAELMAEMGKNATRAAYAAAAAAIEACRALR